MKSKTGYVYMLLFDEPVSPDSPAQTYTGWTADLAGRIQAHMTGNSARIVQVAHGRGIGFELVRVWEGDRKTERRIKNLKMGRKIALGLRNVKFAKELSKEEIDNLLLPF